MQDKPLFGPEALDTRRQCPQFFCSDVASMASRFQILSLSGGGYRGLYTATILAELERALGKPLARCFDLLAGTSVGGILALGLALEIPASHLASLFERHGDEIFRHHFSLRGYFRARYRTASLTALLSRPDIFGARLLESVMHPVVVPAINYSSGLPVVFKTDHHPSFKIDYRHSLVDIALATSAAPFYFRRHIFDNNQYVDGGLFANAPGLVGLHEAETFFKGVCSMGDIHMLSVGTMSSIFTVNPDENCQGGLRDWGQGKALRAAQRLFNVAISVQESFTDNILRHRLTDERYILLDDILSPDRALAVALDKTDAAAREVLIGAGKERAKQALGDRRVTTLLRHTAPPSQFFSRQSSSSPADAHTRSGNA